MIKLLSHLSFVPITTPEVEKSVDSYGNQASLVEAYRDGDRVYLRCWSDFYPSSVAVVRADEPGLETRAWCTSAATGCGPRSGRSRAREPRAGGSRARASAAPTASPDCSVTTAKASTQRARWQIDGDRDPDAGGVIFGISQNMAVPA